MIDELDEAIRQLLIRDLPVKNNEIDIAFHQPKREWSARLSRPTLNLFLYDVRENVKLRQAAPAWMLQQRDAQSVTQKRRPVRIELYYLITAWATEPEDEHRLLTRTLLSLFRYSEFPEDMIPDSLRPQPSPITLEVAQPEGMRNLSEFWSAMDNEIRPAIQFTLALALDPFEPVTTPLVSGRETRWRDMDRG